MFSLILAFSSLLSGCRTPTWDECTTAECRVSTIEEAWGKDPEGVATDLAALDAIEQANLVSIVANAYPNDAEKVCAAVKSDSPAATRCDRLQLRPHLYTSDRSTSRAKPSQAKVISGRAGQLPRPPGLPSPWRKVEESESELRGTCGTDTDCLQDSAWDRAARGDIAGGGALCELAWPAGTTVRNECIFQLAEHLLLSEGSGRVVDALAICGQAGSLDGHCIQHALVLTMPTPAPADASSADNVKEITDYLARIRAAVSPDAGDDYAGLAWSMWTRDAYLAAEVIDGALLGALPAEAAPHVRAAAAWRTLHGDLGEPPTIDGLAGYLKGRLKEQPPLPATGGEATARSTTQPRARWSNDVSETEAALPAIWCLGAGRRTVADNPDDDLRIAAISAMSRIERQPGADFYSAVLGTPQNWRVRWSAARALMEAYPAAAGQYVLRDTDPRIVEVLSR